MGVWVYVGVCIDEWMCGLTRGVGCLRGADLSAQRVQTYKPEHVSVLESIHTRSIHPYTHTHPSPVHTHIPMHSYTHASIHKLIIRPRPPPDITHTVSHSHSHTNIHYIPRPYNPDPDSDPTTNPPTTNTDPTTNPTTNPDPNPPPAPDLSFSSS